MAAIVTAICKSAPAGVFVVCPFLLRCGLLCPTWAPAGAAYPPPPCGGGGIGLGDRPEDFAHTRRENFAGRRPRA